MPLLGQGHTPATVHAEPSHQEIQRTVDRSSSTALATAKRNISFLISPGDARNVPGKFRTRAFLKACHYLGVFLFWRLVRYAKYAAMGAIVAGISATAFGSVVSGAAFFVAPPTFAASTGVGVLWMIGKWGFRKAAARTRGGHQQETQTGHVVPVPEPTFLGDTFE